MTAVLRDDTALFKQFMDNEGFKWWMHCFQGTHHRPPSELGDGVVTPPSKHRLLVEGWVAMQGRGRAVSCTRPGGVMSPASVRREEGGQTIRGPLLHIGQHVAVHVQREGRTRMAQPFRNHLHVLAGG